MKERVKRYLAGKAGVAEAQAQSKPKVMHKVRGRKIRLIQTFSDLPILVWLANTFDEERM